MKKFKGKYAALIALILGVVGWGFMITEYILYIKNPPDPSIKISLPDLQYLVKGLGYSALSVIPFSVEGIRSIVRATRSADRRRLVWDIASAVLTLGLIPMLYFSLAYYAVWLCYYGVVFIAELISVILHCVKKPPEYSY
jgi:hypothetical protein